jgi:hypothetical protein
VPLQNVLLPDQHLVVYIAFELQLEPTRVALNGTLGFTDNVLTLANFHPTVAVYQNGKWQSEQPVHGIAAVPENSFYLVRLKTPGDLSVIASGVEIGRDMLNEYQIVTFAAGPIGQFYLTASNRYTVALSQMVGDTKVTSYAYAEHLTGQARTALGYAVAALENLNARYGIYPFTRLDIVGTPTMGVAKPVMAYPGVILIDLNKYDMVYAFGERSLESAVTFGVTQQWFGRIISSNRLKAPWLSESLSEFVAQSVMTDLYGWEVTAKQRSNYLRSYAVPIGLSAYSYALGDYQATMYGRGPDFLYILSHKLGEDVGEKMLRDYYQSYKWDGGSLPSTESFQQLAEEHCTCDLEILFANWIELQE